MQAYQLVKAGLKRVAQEVPQLKEWHQQWQWKTDSEKWRKLAEATEIFQRDSAGGSVEYTVERLVTAAFFCIYEDKKWNLCNLLQKARSKKYASFNEDGCSLADLLREGGELKKPESEEEKRRKHLQARSAYRREYNRKKRALSTVQDRSAQAPETRSRNMERRVRNI